MVFAKKARPPFERNTTASSGLPVVWKYAVQRLAGLIVGWRVLETANAFKGRGGNELGDQVRHLLGVAKLAVYHSFVPV